MLLPPANHCSLKAIKRIKVKSSALLAIHLSPALSLTKQEVVNVLSTFLFSFAPNLLVLLAVVLNKQGTFDIKRNQHRILHLITRDTVTLFVLTLQYLIRIEVFQVFLQTLLFNGWILNSIDVLNRRI